MKTEPIPVKDALKLCEMAIQETATASPDWWTMSWARSKMDEQDAAFVVLARSVMRPMLEALVHDIKFHVDVCEGAYIDTSIEVGQNLYPPLAALRGHYDAVRPDWRMSK